jgi:hypothetical protein
MRSPPLIRRPATRDVGDDLARPRIGDPHGTGLGSPDAHRVAPAVGNRDHRPPGPG